MSMAAAIVGLVALFYVVPELGAGRGLYWGTVVFTVVMLLAAALLSLAAVWPRSVPAAMGSALPIGFLVIVGLGAEPMSWPRFLLNAAAIVGLAALLIEVRRGLAQRRFRVLSILPALGLGLPIGYLVGALFGLHIVTQYCRLPLIGAEVSSFLCSG